MSSLLPLLLNIFPSLTNPQGYAARSRLVNAFAEYYRSNGHAQASRLIHDRFTLARENGISIEDIAALEIAILSAALSNSIRTTFWVIYHVYSSPNLLQDLRQELGAQTKREEIAQGERDEKGESRNPILASIVKETIRAHTTGATTRYVARDTALSALSSSSTNKNREYLLKRGSLVVIPMESIHANTSLWGHDAERFDPHRFCKDTNGLKEDGTRVRLTNRATAFRAFGSGANICPGRFLAAGGIERVIEMLVRDWEIKPVKERWEIGRGWADDVSDTVRPPDGDIEVWITRRRH
ncbi:MAG: hypothetical protein Q9195_006786 [Heterodermia aff. obscurata]